MTGCLVAWACLVAWRLGELSQQSVDPHCWQVRRCSHREWTFTHSSHSRRFAWSTLVVAAMWGQLASVMVRIPLFFTIVDWSHRIDDVVSNAHVIFSAALPP